MAFKPPVSNSPEIPVNSGLPCRTITLSMSKDKVPYAGLQLLFIYLDFFSLHHIAHIDVLLAIHEG